MTTKEDKDEEFLSRWSRMKREARDQPPQKAADAPVDPKAPPPELPPVDKLTLDSDYKAFFHPKVDEDVRRAALKKLFSDKRFNVMDGLDVYIDDYSKTEPIPPAMLAGLRQAQNILQWAKEDTEERARKAEAQAQAKSGQVTESPAPRLQEDAAARTESADPAAATPTAASVDRQSKP